MISAKTANASTFFSVFYQRLNFWTLNFNALYLLRKMFAPLFNNVYLHAFCHLSTFVVLLAKHPVYSCNTFDNFLSLKNFDTLLDHYI